MSGVAEIGPEAYDWGWYQGWSAGAGRTAGKPRFDATKHRVFALVRRPEHRHSVDEDLFCDILAWIDEQGWKVDGWHSRDPEGLLHSAIFRFRASQRQQAEIFYRRWVVGRHVHPVPETVQ